VWVSCRCRVATRAYGSVRYFIIVIVWAGNEVFGAMPHADVNKQPCLRFTAMVRLLEDLLKYVLEMPEVCSWSRDFSCGYVWCKLKLLSCSLNS
jgi:hypothetical protein